MDQNFIATLPDGTDIMVEVGDTLIRSVEPRVVVVNYCSSYVALKEDRGPGASPRHFITPFQYGTLRHEIATGITIVHKPAWAAPGTATSTLGPLHKGPTQAAQTAQIWAVGDQFRAITNLFTFKEYNHSTDEWTITWHHGATGIALYSTTEIEAYFQTGAWKLVGPSKAVDPYTLSPELYRPGEAAQAVAFSTQRAHVRSLLGLEEKLAQHESKEEKPASNSIFECPYEAYDTKYGDW